MPLAEVGDARHRTQSPKGRPTSSSIEGTGLFVKVSAAGGSQRLLRPAALAAGENHQGRPLVGAASPPPPPLFTRPDTHYLKLATPADAIPGIPTSGGAGLGLAESDPPLPFMRL